MTRRPSTSPGPSSLSERPSFSSLRPTVSRNPPSYAHSSLDRLSPMGRALDLPEQPRVPPPIYLRSSSPQARSKTGTLEIRVSAWGVALVRPPCRPTYLHPDDMQSPSETIPPTDDSIVSGYIEVTMKERRRCQAISVGVQSVCRLYMGPGRGWEEDGVFERGVEVMGGDAEGIWLEQGSQSFAFSILLPATLATHDFHPYGRISYILTARVEGIPASSSYSSIFKRSSDSNLPEDIPFRGEFERVIARSDKLAQDLASGKGLGRNGNTNSNSNSPHLMPSYSPRGSSADLLEAPDESAIAIEGGSSPQLKGLYHRRQDSDVQGIPPLSLSPIPSRNDDRRSVLSFKSGHSGNGSFVSNLGGRSEKEGWMKGDLCASRVLVVHAIPQEGEGMLGLDLRKEGWVEGLNSWRFSAVSDAFTISGVMVVSINIPSPSPTTTIFFSRLLVTQTYSLYSPRTPNDPPYTPEPTTKHVVYQVGRPTKSGDRFPGYKDEALWRGHQARGRPGAEASPGASDEEGWKVRAVVRMPKHDKIRPSTAEGTITPIRVSHQFLLQVFYSIDQEEVTGKARKGPGELRMMQVKMNVFVPSCCCVINSLVLPTYDHISSESLNIQKAFAAPEPPEMKMCVCGKSFAEMGELAMRRMQAIERAEAEESESGSLRTPGMARKESDSGAGGGGGGGGSGRSTSRDRGGENS